jgi:ribosomal protein S18 acetylase RimI-like enzyme
MLADLLYDCTMIRLLEELSLSALPALETTFLDGWVLRLSDNYTRRANSINPLYPGARPLAENLRDAEDIYRRHGQRVVFKLTPASLPEGLDQALDEQGYAREAPTSVQTLDLAGQLAPALGRTTLEERLSTDWLTAVFKLNAVPERHQPTMQQMLMRVAPRTCFASLSVDGQVVSVGLGVLQSGWLGLYDIVTQTEHRGQGHARQLINDLLAWARPQGATSAYLQVMKNNAAALRLYERMGFKEQYEYWYRVKG